MLDNGQKKSRAELRNTEKRLNAIYTPVMREITAEIEPYLEAIEQEIDGAEPPELKRIARRSKKPVIIAGILAIGITQANEQALLVTNKMAGNVHLANYAYMLDVFLRHGRPINGAKPANKGLSKYSKRSYDRLIQTPHISAALDKMIKKLIAQGKSTPVIAKAIRREFGKSLTKSKLTARTEATRLENAARVDVFAEAEKQGIEFKKEWFATIPGGGRTRDSHLAMHGEIVGADELFSNGLECPGDPKGAAREVCNCRCCIRPRFGGK